MSTPTATSGAYLGPGLPAPQPTSVDEVYWQEARAHRLVVQKCGDCGASEWPPEEVCRHCGSSNRTWSPASGEGTIHTWTRIWHSVHPALDGHCPYVVVVIRLADHDVLMAGNLLGDPELDVEIGQAVTAVFEERADKDVTLVQWMRAGVASGAPGRGS
jgi:uncharacterized OB-fold protein